MEESSQKYTSGREKRVVFSVSSTVSGEKSRIRGIHVGKRFMMMFWRRDCRWAMGGGMSVERERRFLLPWGNSRSLGKSWAVAKRRSKRNRARSGECSLTPRDGHGQLVWPKLAETFKEPGRALKSLLQLGKSPSWLKADLETRACLQGCTVQAKNCYFCPVWPCLRALLFTKLIILVCI